MQLRIGSQIVNQIGGMGKMSALKLLITHIGRPVSAKCQHMVYMSLPELGGYRVDILFSGADAGHMGQCPDMKLILDIGSNLYGFF